MLKNQNQNFFVLIPNINISLCAEKFVTFFSELYFAIQEINYV